MKKLLLFASLIFCFGAFSQTTLFQDDFESGGGNWSLNVGGSGANNWIINNAYSGVIFTPTPTQPGAITNSPQSQYLHIFNASACSNGDCQAVFLAQSGGSRTAEMANSISTVGVTNVNLDFYYLCNGWSGSTYGTVDYSLDDGSTWTNTGVQYAGIANWTAETLTDAAWENQPTLKFRFHWIESNTGSDPSFSVDEISITGTGGATNSITTGSIAQSAWCFGTTVNDVLNFTASGTFNAGNVYTAQMSDGTGSFASPTAVGTLNSSASGNLSINITIPGTMPPGAGYRLRVVASDPATTGTDNGSDLEIYSAPTVTMQPLSDVCSTASAFALSGGSPAGGTYSGTGVSGGNFDPSVSGAGTFTITYDYTDGNGCSGTASQPITVNTAPTVTMQPLSDVCSTASAFALSGGSPAGGTYSGTGVSGGNFDPSTAGAGTHTITYTYTDGNGCSGSASQTITVTNGVTVTQQPFSDVCSTGGVVTLVGGSPAGGTYSGTGVSGNNFDPSVSGLGTFTITYSYDDGNGCSGSASETITVIQGPTVTLDEFANVCYDDPFFTLTGGTPSNGTYTGAGVSGGVFDPSTAGLGTHTITYTFTDGNGCSGTATSTITVEQCGGINDLNPVVFTLQPNPTKEAFEVVTSENIESIVLLDMTGRVLKNYDVSETTFSVKDIPSGVYIVQVSVNGKLGKQRLVVQ